MAGMMKEVGLLSREAHRTRMTYVQLYLLLAILLEKRVIGLLRRYSDVLYEQKSESLHLNHTRPPSWIYPRDMAVYVLHFAWQTYPKGPRTQIMGFQRPNAMILMVYGP